ncbi:MAG: hypothetical protein VZR02_00800 [Lachnospiraceae bacterium]|nr:hypothetical protein [Lachnospiraceae bacterium]
MKKYRTRKIGALGLTLALACSVTACGTKENVISSAAVSVESEVEENEGTPIPEVTSAAESYGTISSAESRPDEEETNAEDSACVSVPYDTAVTFDGQALTASVTPKDGSMSTLTITYGDKRTDEEIMSSQAGACLVRSGGQAFLYIDSAWDNDYHSTLIYRLSDLARVSEVDAGMQNGLPTDAANMTFVRRFDLLGTYTATGQYKVGEDGLPVLKDPWYTITDGLGNTPNRETAAPRQITARQDLTSDEGASIPAGTALTLDKTDGESRVRLLDPSGQTVTFTVIVDQDHAEQTIGGVSIDDLFEGLLFAG